LRFSTEVPQQFEFSPRQPHGLAIDRNGHGVEVGDEVRAR